MERGYNLKNVKLTVQLALAAPVGAAPLVHLKLATVPAGQGPSAAPLLQVTVAPSGGKTPKKHSPAGAAPIPTNGAPSPILQVPRAGDQTPFWQVADTAPLGVQPRLQATVATVPTGFTGSVEVL